MPDVPGWSEIPVSMGGGEWRMRILVTGGAGFIGSHVVDRFVAEGHEVAALDDLSTGFKHLVNRAATFYEVDIRDAGALESAISEFQPEIIDHHAAQIDVRRSVLDPVYDAETNVIGSLNLLQSSSSNGVRKIIYASTGGALYGEAKQLPADEDHPVNPESPYGVSKHTVEHYLYLFRLVEGIDYTILRYPNVFGPRQNPHGEAGVNAIFIGLMMEGKTPVIFGDGEQVRDYLYVGDVAEANVLALEKGSQEILNLGWARGVSVNDIFHALKSLLDFPGEARYAERRAGEVQRIYLDAERAKRVLGWTPNVSFEEGLERTIAWYREAKQESSTAD
jgi:UDP-glucose 4-epimerase